MLRALLALALLRAVGSQPQASAWPLYGRDGQHTCTSPYSGPLLAPYVNWTYTTPAAAAITTGISINSDNNVFFGSSDGSITALDGFTGTMKWRYVDPSGSVASGGSPVIDVSGRIFFTIGSFAVGLFPNGTIVWRKLIAAGRSFTAPTMGASGALYFGDSGNTFYALSSSTGAVLWSWCCSTSHFDGVAAISPIDGTVIAHAFPGTFQIFDNKTGAIKAGSGYNPGNELVTSDAIDSLGNIYAGGTPQSSTLPHIQWPRGGLFRQARCSVGWQFTARLCTQARTLLKCGPFIERPERQRGCTLQGGAFAPRPWSIRMG